MKYLSVCSGVEAATVAWHDLGWQPVAFSEIEKFPSEVLAHHYPNVPNVGDMTKYKEWNLNDSINLLVGGTPCQSFSVAGLRKGLEDPRGNLMLTYVGILDKFRPKWCVWENVPGVLSSNGGRDFGSFLGALVELGYGFAYRVLDAQNFGVPQRRRRVFVVGCLGDWISPSKVLFEPDCLLGDSKKSRSKKQGTPAFTSSSFGGYSEGVGTVRASGGDLGGGSETLIATPDLEHTIDTTGTQGVAYGFTQCDAARDIGDDVSPTLRSGGDGGYPNHAVAYSIREDAKANNFSATALEVTPALQALRPSVQSHHAQTFIAQTMAVRRLTPVECERLQGFPDNYTNIPWRKKDEAPDGPRYKAMGNSMAVPVMKWIGQRIEEMV